MRPRTKLQVRVKALSDALPAITEEQKAWAFKHCLVHRAHRTKTNTSCLDCGHIWKGEQKIKTCDCPACGVKLDIIDTRTKIMAQRTYLCQLDICDGFQVNRFWEINSYHKAGTTAKKYASEIVQQWMQPDGKNEVVAKNRDGYSNNFHGDLQIRDRQTLSWKYNVYPTRILPGGKCLPIYRRNGMVGKIDINIGPYDLFTALLKDTIAETLLKAKQYELLRARCGNRSSSVGRYWDSIKICIRNKYLVKEGITWLDYLELLAYFKKDLKNPKYICPKDLHQEHNKLVAKKTAIDTREHHTRWLITMGLKAEEIKNWSIGKMVSEYERIRAEKAAVELRERYIRWLMQLGKKKRVIKDWTIEQLIAEYDSIKTEEAAQRKAKEEEERIKKIKGAELAYQEAKAMFFGVVFSSRELTVKVLESIQEFFEEGEAHKHCVFASKYYEKKDSLILSARVEGKPIETIEIDLTKMTIVQSRGLENKASKYHDQIIELVKKNIPVLKRKYKKIKAAHVAAA